MSPFLRVPPHVSIEKEKESVTAKVSLPSSKVAPRLEAKPKPWLSQLGGHDDDEDKVSVQR